MDGLDTPVLYVTDTITIGDAGLRLRRHVLAFFQGNRYLLRDLVAHVTDRVPIGGAVLDLYAGVGLFSVAAAIIRGAAVVAVEGDAYAADDLHANAAAAGGQITTVRGAVEGIATGRSRRGVGRLASRGRDHHRRSAADGHVAEAPSTRS